MTKPKRKTKEILADIVKLYDDGDVAEIGGGCDCCGTWAETSDKFKALIVEAKEVLQ